MNLEDKFKALVEQCAGGIVERVTSDPEIHALVNAGVIGHLVEATAGRPLPYSLWTGRPIGVPYIGGVPEASSDYVTWAGLTDRRFTGRHLPPVDDATVAKLPSTDALWALFERKAFVASTNTSTLLCYFAQWFTDSFLRTSAYDTRLNTSNHEIDLCQIYGLDAETAALLRTGAGGLLRTSAGGLYPARLFDVHGTLNPQFATLPYLQRLPDGTTLEDIVLGSLNVPEAELLTRKQGLYATGLERGNSTILYTAISSIFLREHNRLCGRAGGGAPGLGRRPAVPDGAQHQHRSAAEADDQRIHQPPGRRADETVAAARVRRNDAVVSHQPDRHRVRPALPLALAGARCDRGGRPRLFGRRVSLQQWRCWSSMGRKP